MKRIMNGIVYKTNSELEKENEIYDNIIYKADPLLNRLETINEKISYVESDIHYYYEYGYSYNDKENEEYITNKEKEFEKLKKRKERINEKLKRLEKRYINWKIKWYSTRGYEFCDDLNFWIKRLREFNKNEENKNGK